MCEKSGDSPLSALRPRLSRMLLLVGSASGEGTITHDPYSADSGAEQWRVTLSRHRGRRSHVHSRTSGRSCRFAVFDVGVSCPCENGGPTKLNIVKPRPTYGDINSRNSVCTPILQTISSCKSASSDDINIYSYSNPPVFTNPLGLFSESCCFHSDWRAIRVWRATCRARNRIPRR